MANQTLTTKTSKRQSATNFLSPIKDLFKRSKSTDAITGSGRLNPRTQGHSRAVSESFRAPRPYNPFSGNDEEITISVPDVFSAFQPSAGVLNDSDSLNHASFVQTGIRPYLNAPNLDSIHDPNSSTTSYQSINGRTSFKEGFGVASRFAQTLLNKVPDCVDSNPVKVAFSIARAILDIKNAIGDNKEELSRLLGQTADRLLTVERTIAIGVPQSAVDHLEIFRRIIREEMRNLEDLAGTSQGKKILDHEQQKATIFRIFQRVNEATTIFQLEVANGIQETANKILDQNKDTALQRLCPSKKADHRTAVDQQALKRETCTAGTRVKILDDITAWANDHSSDSARVFWLTGHAGSGKTTIAYTIAKRFDGRHGTNSTTILGGNFLCSRYSEETQDQSRIVPTIVYHLARKCKSYANALHVADKFDSVSYDSATQLKDLLVGPWQQSEPIRDELGSSALYLVVIDALDEIKGQGGSVFLQDLLNAINNFNLRGLKFLVTSRPNPEIVDLCGSFSDKAVCRLQGVPIEEAKADIETYINTKLPKLSSRPEMGRLLDRAGGLFIYAATVVRYLTLHKSLTFTEQVKMLNTLLNKTYDSDSVGDATFLIDELYRQIMCDAFSQLKGGILTRRLHILRTFLCTAERTSVSVVASLLPKDDNNNLGNSSIEDDDEEIEVVEKVLHDLHPVLYIQDGCVFWYHSSFPDFIFDQTRSNFHINEESYRYWCDGPVHHKLLAESSFRVMESGLRFNICNISSSFLLDREHVPTLSQQANERILPVLKYASRYWVHHLPTPEQADANHLADCISAFLKIRVLFWIEAMNLVGLSRECTPMLQRARLWLLECNRHYLELARDIAEAANFATHFAGSPAAESTPHLYISALALWFWSHNTSLSRMWKQQFSRVPVFTHSKGSISLPLMSWESSRSPISAIAFSWDGTQIVSGGRSDHVRIWDASTGSELLTLKHHSGYVTAVAFSKDATRVVAGYMDNSLQVWEAVTGAHLHTLNGHRYEVTSVVFSNDGTRIVSGSQDRRVRVWDAQTGEELNTLEGHAYSVLSVGFSSDGTQVLSFDGSLRIWDLSSATAPRPVEMKGLTGTTLRLAAMSSDGTRIASSSSWTSSVQVWNGSTGEKMFELKGHTNNVMAIAFSSDGTRIASGAYDHSVRVWDGLTGAQLISLSAHSTWVLSVAFSPDGTQILSGSLDGTLRVWDASNSATKFNKSNGHTDSVQSVRFSHDGKLIVSGSWDKTVRVWDTSTGEEVYQLQGHTDDIQSVAFSNDGRWIASASKDESVRLWDTNTQKEVFEMQGHTGAVMSVAFSSDGAQIASGGDKSLRIWDTSTGKELERRYHMEDVECVAWSAESNVVVSSSAKMAGVFSVSPGTGALEMLGLIFLDEPTELTRVSKDPPKFVSVAISHNGGQVVYSSSDGAVRVWDLSLCKNVHTFNCLGTSQSVTVPLVLRLPGSPDRDVDRSFATRSSYCSVAISYDGTWIVASDPLVLRVWDISTDTEHMVLEGHTDTITSVAFSRDGRKIVSGSDDQSVRLWDVSESAEDRSLTSNRQSPEVGSNWSRGRTGWITTSKGNYSLIWMPLLVGEVEPFEPSKMVISLKETGYVDFRRAGVGADWVECYTPWLSE